MAPPKSEGHGNGGFTTALLLGIYKSHVVMAPKNLRQIADESGGGGVEDGDGGVVAGVEVAGGEDAHLAGGGASGEHGGIALGGAFDEDFEGFADVPAVAFEGLAVLEVNDF